MRGLPFSVYTHLRVTAISSIAYAITAAFVLYTGGEHAVPVAIGFTLLAIGSALYHGTGKKWARSLDECGMYAASIPLMWAAIDLAVDAHTTSFHMSMLAQFVLFAALHRSIDSFIAMPLLILITIGFAGYFGSLLLAVIAATVFGLAVGIRNWGPHNAPVQHSVWHILSATALGLLYAAI